MSNVFYRTPPVAASISGIFLDISSGIFLDDKDWDHSFITYAKFFENLTFLTSWYAHFIFPEILRTYQMNDPNAKCYEFLCMCVCVLIYHFLFFQSKWFIFCCYEVNASCSFFLHEKLKKFIWLKWWFYTMWKTPNTEYFLVRIFLGLDWIRTFMSRAPYSVWMQKKIRTKKGLVFGHFTQ